MTNEEYQEAEYIVDTLTTYIEAIINQDYNYDAYVEAKKDLIKIIHEKLLGGKHGSKS